MLKRLAEQAQEKGEGSKKLRFLSRAHQVTVAEIYSQPRILSRDENIYSVPTGQQHQAAKLALSRSLSTNNIWNANVKVVAYSQVTRVFNQFACGTTQVKVSDGGMTILQNNENFQSGILPRYRNLLVV